MCGHTAFCSIRLSEYIPSICSRPHGIASNSHFGGGDGEEEGRERAKKDRKLRG